MKTEGIRRPGELFFALTLVVFSVALFWQSHAISGFSGLSTAGVFPMFASATMVVCSILILAGNLRAAGPDPSGGAEIKRFAREVVPLRLTAMIGLIAAYAAAMPLLGFLTSSAAFLLLSFAYLWRKGFLVSAVLAAVSLIAVHIIFRKVFLVVLPEGSLTNGLF